MTTTKIMGILNVTPDSSYDKGKYFIFEDAVERGITLYKEGADWLDIGGESTRPKATPVSEKEELQRVLPIITALKKEIPIPISIDTMKASVAQAAIDAGATLINDVSGFRDANMRAVAIQSQLPFCIMHMHETPQTMQENVMTTKDIIPFLLNWFEERIELLLKEGAKEVNIILDPGIGFGKTMQHNFSILKHLDQFKKLGFPILISLSRKSFLGKLIDKTYPDLLAVSLMANTIAIQKNIDIIRVHDVLEHRQILQLMNYMDSIN